ncbi:MAG: helix-turn-helix transcriptional regulator [Clostridia bacterium]|nr:helix-turn-helix transcriptional regulator [Clostridia bacterium]
MNLEDAIKNRINYFCNQKGYTLWELYKSSGVPKSTINSLLGTEKTSLPKLPTLLHICEGLGTNLKDFFNDDSFIDIMDDTEDKD